jgi:mannose-6-phosphate isomerase
MIVSHLPNRVFRTYTGGRLLDELQGVAIPQDSHHPEEWIGSTTLAINPNPVPNEGLSRVQLKDGSTPFLKDLIQEDPQFWLGREHLERFGASPDVLVKYLDSAIRLHIQVHPLPEFSKQYLGSEKGKTEAWVVLQLRSERDMGYVYLGFQHTPDVAEWARIIRQQDIQAMEACFERIYVQPGDLFIVNGSTPHAIGPGILMIEIQEPSDFVVRCEFERGGYLLPDSARFMNLGLERSLEMFDYSEVRQDEVIRRWRLEPECLVEGPSGSIQRIIGPSATDKFVAYRLRAKAELEISNDRFSICAVIEGKGEVKSASVRLFVNNGDTFVVPASCPLWTLDPVTDSVQVIMARRF